MAGVALKKNCRRVNESVIEPQVARYGLKFQTWIDIRSPQWQREACVQLRRYQSRECDDGMSMDASSECWVKVECRAFSEKIYKPDGRMRMGLIGAVGFERDVVFEDGRKLNVMQFAWLHPFCRNKGFVKSAWPEFIRRFGKFYVSTPRSPSMQALLKQVAYSDPPQ